MRLEPRCCRCHIIMFSFGFRLALQNAQDPTKKVFDLIIGIFSHPPRARSIDPGHFVGNLLVGNRLL